MPRQTRRQFVKQSLAVAGATVALSGTKATRRVLGANERINHAVAGINGRGGAHIGEFTQMKDVQVACLIDPDARLFSSKVKTVEQKAGNTPKAVKDYREALDDKGIDTLSIATCNHWHAPMTIFACQAGKDVYVEKPMSHNIHEGRIAVETARKYNRIVQHGTQSRGSSGWQKVQEYARHGGLGKLLVSRGLCYKRRGSIGFKEPTDPPAGLDFDIWLGPAPKQPYHANLVHYNWHWFWDFGNGDIGNQGVHQMDIARWQCPDATWPKKVFSIGGRFGYQDQGQTPNTQMVIYDYGPDKPMIVFEVRGLAKDVRYMSAGVGNMAHFQEGTIVGAGQYFPRNEKNPAPVPKVDAKLPGSGSVFSNFIDCVRSRKREELLADVLVAHYSAGLCHLGNISYRLGQSMPYDKTRKSLGDNKEAVDTFERMAEHLKANELKLNEMDYTVGPVLSFDADTEQFTGEHAAEANKLLTRDYRKPFQIPTKAELAAAGA